MENHDTDIHELNGTSPDFHTELAKQLQRIVPEAIADGKVDVVKLSELLQEDAGDTNERFGLFWPGKKRAMRAAQEPTTATLKPAKDLSKDWDTTQNIFIEGDNLEVLKLLQKQYHSSIKMIYIDPPYNTGKDFVYPDNFQEGLQNYLEFSKQVDEGNKKISTNTETTGRYHSNWLNMIYPRLKLARNLLTDDGVIFISIDDNEYTNLKKLCDEIFGESNFVIDFPRVTKKGGKSSDVVAKNHDSVLMYVRNTSAKGLYPIAHDDDGFKNKDEYFEERGYYKLNQTLDYDSLGYVQSLDYPIEIEGQTFYAGGSKADYEQRQAGHHGRADWGWRWRWSKPLYEFGKANGFVVLKDTKNGGRIYTKTYQNASIEKIGNSYIVTQKERTKPLSTLEFTNNIYSNDNATKGVADLLGKGIFEYTKPVSLMAMFALLATRDSDIVLDFFSGSGTTAHAVMQLNAEDGGNRRHIQVQLPEPTDENSEAYKAGYHKISDIARERINRAGEKIKADFADKLAQRDAPLDIGYRTYKLSDTNFTKWQSSYTADVSALQQRLDLMRESSNDSASEQDLLTEIMLKIGLPLITKVEPAEINGLVYYRINDSLLVYLNEKVKPSLDQLRSAADKLPSKFVILEDAFQGDDQLKTNLHQICKTNKIELWTV